MRLNRFTIAILATCGSLVIETEVLAGFDARGSLESSAQFQQIHSEAIGNADLLTLEVDPSLGISYQSPKLNGYWEGNVRHITRDSDEFSSDNTFPEYQYNAEYQVIDRVLTFGAQGTLTYQNVNPYDFLVSDIFINDDNLAKARSNRYTSTLSLMNGDWVRGTGTVSYSEVDAETSQVSFSNLRDNETYAAQGYLQNGDRAKRVLWSLSGSYQQTDRSQNNLGEFISRTGSGYVDTMVIDDWGIRLSANHEANQLSSRDDTVGNTRKYTSVGAGITYRQSVSRYISLTANKVTSQTDQDEDEVYPGIDLRWAFTPRTAVGLQYGRRVFGESLNADMSYNTKHLRSTIRYSEDITSFSRLLSDPQNLGLFVCPLDNVSLVSCFQPSSLDYELQQGEQFTPFVDQNIVLDDNILLRKSSVIQLGYDFSRTRLSWTFNYSKDDYLDTERVRRTYGSSLSARVALNSRTNFLTTVRYANIEQQSGEDAVPSGSSDNWNITAGLTRQLGRQLSANIELGYVSKSGDLGAGRLGPEYQDRRISVGFTYRFD